MADRKAKRVLVVEDEFLVALHLEDLLTELGHQVVGPAGRINEALDLARSCEIDFAVLDVNLAHRASLDEGPDLYRHSGTRTTVA